MRKGLTELVMILDRSGSMSGLEADTIGGFNGMIEKQKREEGEAYVTVVLFDDRIETLYDRVDVQKIEPMNNSQYYVRGCTALLDAIGETIGVQSRENEYCEFYFTLRRASAGETEKSEKGERKRGENE